MRLRQLRTPFFASLAALTACGSVPTRTFDFAAINADQRAVPAIVVVDQDWIGAAEKKQFVNVDNKSLPITIAYPDGRQEVEVTVAAILVDPDDASKITWSPTRSTDTNPAIAEKPELRRLRLLDPVRQLFILDK